MSELLDHEVPGLAKKLQAISAAQRRDILAKTCLVASECLNELEASVGELVESLRLHRILSADEAARAISLAEKADSEYLDVQSQSANQCKALAFFSQARLLTAMGIGFRGTSWQDCADAIYELCKVCDDPSSVVRAVKTAIGSISEH